MKKLLILLLAVLALANENIHPTSLIITPNPIQLNKGTSLRLNTSVVYNDGST